MARAIELRFKGMPEVREELRSLRSDVQSSIAWKAAIAGAGAVARKARINAQRQFKPGPGRLAKHIALVKVKGGGTRYQYSVGVRAGANRTRKQVKQQQVVKNRSGMGFRKIYPHDPYYWWHHEFGFMHYAGKGKPRVAVPARPFLTTAMVSERDKALSAMARQLLNRLNKVRNAPR
jgi:hypothetical protein